MYKFYLEEQKKAHIKPILLTTAKITKFKLALTGWGRTDGDTPIATHLQRGIVEVYNHSICAQKFKDYNIGSNHICAIGN